MSSPYPKRVLEKIRPSRDRDIASPDATGRAADFLCGVSVEFRLVINPAAGAIERISYSTNGCGYVVASAAIISEKIRGIRLVDLQALNVLETEVEQGIGLPPDGRNHCINLSFDSLQNALANLRENRIGEWNGDEALICSCFGISAQVIEGLIDEGSLATVEAVGERCGAGTGCGSCQLLIQEILDTVDSR